MRWPIFKNLGIYLFSLKGKDLITRHYAFFS
jgi:hypothetical protein